MEESKAVSYDTHNTDTEGPQSCFTHSSAMYQTTFTLARGAATTKVTDMMPDSISAYRASCAGNRFAKVQTDHALGFTFEGNKKVRPSAPPRAGSGHDPPRPCAAHRARAPCPIPWPRGCPAPGERRR